jgi:hypothetical protein
LLIKIRRRDASTNFHDPAYVDPADGDVIYNPGVINNVENRETNTNAKRMIIFATMAIVKFNTKRKKNQTNVEQPYPYHLRINGQL